MEKSIKAAEEYAERARQSIQEARSHLKNDYLETAVSTSYYFCFYAIHSQLAHLGIEASSHKQTGIQFRRHFIRNKKLPVKLSQTWQQLSEWRMEVDYAPLPEIDKNKAEELVNAADEFVIKTLNLELP